MKDIFQKSAKEAPGGKSIEEWVYQVKNLKIAEAEMTIKQQYYS